MARIINGLISGKLGNMIYYIKNGKQMARVRRKVTREPTAEQLQNREELKVTVNFIKHLVEFVAVGFPVSKRGYLNGLTGYNLAVSYNKRNALTGDIPEVEIDYAKVLVANGNLIKAIGPEVAMESNGLRFTWLCPEGMDWFYYGDQVMMMAYFPEQQQAEYIVAGARRGVCTDFLELSGVQLGQRMEVYISFVSEDRKSAAASVYLGRLN